MRETIFLLVCWNEIQSSSFARIMDDECPSSDGVDTDQIKSGSLLLLDIAIPKHLVLDRQVLK